MPKSFPILRHSSILDVQQDARSDRRRMQRPTDLDGQSHEPCVLHPLTLASSSPPPLVGAEAGEVSS
jgi:hypothetical protein